jgi:hypothetical protein
MKALSLRQPWLWLVLHEDKHIENRKLWWSYRGPILLHAAKAMTKKDYEDAERFVREQVDTKLKLPAFEDPAYLRGGIVGRARITDAFRPCEDDGWTCDRPWHMHDQNGYVLEDVEVLPFVAMPGRLGLFEVSWPPATLAASEAS